MWTLVSDAPPATFCSREMDPEKREFTFNVFLLNCMRRSGACAMELGVPALQAQILKEAKAKKAKK